MGPVTGNKRLEVTCIQLSTLMGYWKVKTERELSLALKAVKEAATSLYYHKRIWKKKKEFWVYQVFSKARMRERGRQSNKMARGWDGHCQEAQPVWNSWQWAGTTKWFTHLVAPWTWFHLCADFFNSKYHSITGPSLDASVDVELRTRRADYKLFSDLTVQRATISNSALFKGWLKHASCLPCSTTG